MWWEHSTGCPTIIAAQVHIAGSSLSVEFSFRWDYLKIGNMVAEYNFRGISFHGITRKFGRVSAQCEAM